jgi:hypothetical protein
MNSVPRLLLLTHLIGLALALGAATAKVGLLLKWSREPAAWPLYRAAAKPLTRQIIMGMVLLTLSGIGWLFVGQPFTPRLVLKVILVGAVWVLGPYIDNVVEPRVEKLTPGPGEAPSLESIRMQRHYLTVEITATALLYTIVAMWVLA